MKKTKVMPWEELVGPHGPPQAGEIPDQLGRVKMTEEQRVNLLRALHSTFVDLRCTMYTEPTREYVSWVSHVGRCLHNVPTWLEEGMIRPDDYAWVMKQYHEHFGQPTVKFTERDAP